MKLRKPHTEQSFDNCNYEFGIEYAISEVQDTVMRDIVGLVKKLPSYTDRNSDYQDSVERFLGNVFEGYLSIKGSTTRVSRMMEKLPSVCIVCRSQGDCYKVSNGKFEKGHPTKEE